MYATVVDSNSDVFEHSDMHNFNDLLADFRVQIAELDIADGIVVDQEMLRQVTVLCEHMNHLRDRLYRKFDYDQSWVGEGFPNASQAISRLTHCSTSKAKSSLKRVEFLEEFPIVEKALVDHTISAEHVDSLARLYGDNFYSKHIHQDIVKLLDNAKILTANEFGIVVKQWKYIVADLEENLEDERNVLERYERRSFAMWKTPCGDYMLEGCLDQVTGELVEKTLGNVNSFIWENSTVEARGDYNYGRNNVDAIHLIFKGFLSSQYGVAIKDHNLALADIASKEYFCRPALTADVSIDLDQMRSANNGDTSLFLESLMKRKSPLTRAHSRKYLEQLMCDANVAFPIFDGGNIVKDSKNVRTAPRGLKRQLALEHPYCYIEGCGCPAKWCDAHHLKHWAHGGQTVKENMVLLCPKHHTKLHNDKEFERNIRQKLFDPNKQKILGPPI